MRSPRNDLLERFLGRLSLGLALALAVSVPAGFWTLMYNGLSDSLTFQARVKMSALNGLIATFPDLWSFAENRIQGLISHEPAAPDQEWIEVFDKDGGLITSAGVAQKPPVLVRSYPLYDVDTVVGRVSVSRSLSELQNQTWWAALAGAVLGALVMLLVRWGPQRALRKLSDQLFEEKERAHITLRSITDAVLTTDKEGRVAYLNPAAEKMLRAPGSDLIGKEASQVIRLLDEETGVPVPSALTRAVAERRPLVSQGRNLLPAREDRPLAVEEHAAPLFDHHGQLSGGLLCLHDVSAARENLRLRAWEASHDPLTGAANRREFENQVRGALNQAQASDRKFVLAFLDLDHFKVVNDACGHSAGDALLIELTRVMEAMIGPGDFLARLGGDEFGLLLADCDLASGQARATGILEAVAGHRFHSGTQVFSVGVSLGLTAVTRDNYGTKEVLEEADAACYWAKEQGRNRVCTYIPGDLDLASRRNETGWVARITSALADNRFLLYHQLYRNLSPGAGTATHLEVLVRMVDEQGDLVAPGRFMAAAERYDLVADIDRWVIRQVLGNQNRIAARFPGTDLVVSMNLSGASIGSHGLLDFIRQELRDNRNDPRMFCFEMTETAAVKDLAAAIAFMQGCRDLGIRFALDDFGAGASSFQYLKTLPVDYLKIDGSFVRNLRNDGIDRSMTEAINSIGHIVGKLTVAEFVEDEATLEILTALGVDFAQGYAVHQPKPLLGRG